MKCGPDAAQDGHVTAIFYQPYSCANNAGSKKPYGLMYFHFKDNYSRYPYRPFYV